MEYSLRKATAEDIPAINDLFVDMLQSIFHKEDTEGYKEGELDYYFSGGEDWICVAEVNGKVSAFLSIEVHRDQSQGNYLYYDDFCVGRDYRGMGIGTAMMNEAEDFCRKIGFSDIVLHVEKVNTSARRLYEKKGFVLLRDDGSRLCLIKHLVQP